jgi:hypothetical protein
MPRLVHPRLVPSFLNCVILAALPAIAFSADLAFEIPPVPVSVDLAGQPVRLVVSGDIAGPPYRLNLHADLADLQAHMTPLLQAELNKSDRCGERISVETATIVPAAPSARLTVQLHFEKWACIKAFGKENAKRLVGGNGVVETILTPRMEDGAVRLDAAVGKIDADGSLGELLHSGSLGDALRDKIREALLKAIRKSTDLSVLVPEPARQYVNVQSISFSDREGGRLGLRVTAQLRTPDGQVAPLLDQFRNRK